MNNSSSLKLLKNVRKAKLVKLWLTFFTHAVELDRWGQVVEAVDSYQELEGVITNRLEENADLVEEMQYRQTSPNRTFTFEEGECYSLNKILVAIKLRVASMEKIDFDGPSVDQMAMVKDRFVEIVRSGRDATFPFSLDMFATDNIDQIARFESLTPVKKELQLIHSDDSDSDNVNGNDDSGDAMHIPTLGESKDDSNDFDDSGGSRCGRSRSKSPAQCDSVNSKLNDKGGSRYLKYSMNQTPLDELRNESGRSKLVYSAMAITDGGRLKKQKSPTNSKSYMTITIDRVGIKDAGTYLDPFMIVTLADARASIIEQQMTPVATTQRGQYVYFDNIAVNFETPFEHVLEGNCGVFFEFCHFKQAKNKVSCRCWGFLENDEIVEQESISLELYKKPADFRRKRIHLFSVKELYLYINVKIRRQ